MFPGDEYTELFPTIVGLNCQTQWVDLSTTIKMSDVDND